jgi:hypothetical protein
LRKAGVTMRLEAYRGARLEQICHNIINYASNIFTVIIIIVVVVVVVVVVVIEVVMNNHESWRQGE